MTDNTKMTLHKLFLLFSLLLFAAVFFLIVVEGRDNIDSKFSYHLKDGSAVIDGYSGYPTGGLTVPDSIDGYDVREIADCAFAEMNEMKSIVLPDKLKIIGSYAFSGCSSLKTVEVGNSLEKIGDHAFSGCIQLATVEIPESLDEIGASAFEGCSKLSSLTIPDGCRNIGDDAFLFCSKLVLYCADNDYVQNYANENLIETDYRKSDNAMLWKVTVISTASAVCTAAVIFAAVKIGKKRKKLKKTIDKRE